MNKKNQDEIFNEIFDELDNISQEDVDRINQNIDDENKKNQIKNFGVEYDSLSIFYDKFDLFCDAINQVIKKNNKLILKDFTIHKIKINEDLFNNESIELLFTHNDNSTEFKRIIMNRQIFEYFFDNDNKTDKQYHDILNYVLDKSYNLKYKKMRDFRCITNQLLKYEHDSATNMNKKINQIINKFSISDNQHDLLIKKLSKYHKNNYIYKSAFIRAGFSNDFINHFFDELEHNHFIEKNYTIYSPYTLERQMIIINNIDDIPQHYECESTNEEFDTKDQIRIIYKIKKEFL